jgi:hypothetical protein
MPTANPRITITLTPEVHAVLREMSECTGNSQSAIVGGLLQTSLPVFERVVQAIRAARAIEVSAQTEIAAGLERAQDKLEDQMGLFLGTMDEAIKPVLQEAEKVARRAGSGRTRSGRTGPAVQGSTPVPVTRGSGGGKTLRKPKKAGGGRG